jgi:hypothetical protein
MRAANAHGSSLNAVFSTAQTREYDPAAGTLRFPVIATQVLLIDLHGGTLE